MPNATKRPTLLRCEESGEPAPQWTTLGEHERCPWCLNRARVRADGRWAEHDYPAGTRLTTKES